MSRSPMPSSRARNRGWQTGFSTTSPAPCASLIFEMSDPRRPPKPSPVSEAGLGEFGRIAKFFAPLAGPGGLGLKDDAALVDCRPGHRLVVTVDAMVEGVHFLPNDPPNLVAKKLLRVNLSDLAAMAARPLYYLLATALPASLGDDWVECFAGGLGED